MQFVGNKAKERISKRVFQENKARQIFSEFDIRISFYVFWLRNGPLIKHNSCGMGESSKMRTTAYRGRDCQASAVHTHLHHLFSYFWQHFCLLVSCFICRKYVEHSSPKAFKSAEFVPPLDTIKRNLEGPSLGRHMLYPPLSYPSHELERTISHLNLTIHKY